MIKGLRVNCQSAQFASCEKSFHRFYALESLLAVEAVFRFGTNLILI